MKKYKYSFLSFASYLIAFLLTYFIPLLMPPSLYPIVLKFVSSITSKFGNIVALFPFFILILLGIFFALKSNKQKESLWAGSLLALLGILILLFYFLLAAGLMM